MTKRVANLGSADALPLISHPHSVEAHIFETHSSQNGFHISGFSRVVATFVWAIATRVLSRRTVVKKRIAIGVFCLYVCIMHMIKRTANLLGTVSVAIADMMSSIDSDDLDHGASAAGAIITIANFPKQNITELSACLLLSHSATVRLVDKLVTAGLIKKLPGLDGRSFSLSSTRSGLSLANAVLARRQAGLESLLSSLEPAEQRQLASLLGKILTKTTRSPQHASQLCRFCDIASCPQDTCPVEQCACSMQTSQRSKSDSEQKLQKEDTNG